MNFKEKTVSMSVKSSRITRMCPTLSVMLRSYVDKTKSKTKPRSLNNGHYQTQKVLSF